MNHLVGWLRWKLGKTVYRATLVKKLGSNHYGIVSNVYLNIGESVFLTVGNGSYEVHEENCKFDIGNLHICYIDYDTGAPVVWNDSKPVVFSPEVLHAKLDVRDIKAAVQAASGGLGNITVLVLAVAVGAVVGFVIGQNIDLSGGGGGAAAFAFA